MTDERAGLAEWFHETTMGCAHRGDAHECVIRARNMLESDWFAALLEQVETADPDWSNCVHGVKDGCRSFRCGSNCGQTYDRMHPCLACVTAEMVELRDERDAVAAKVADKLDPLWALLAEWESWQENPDPDDDAEATVTTVVTGLRYALNKATLGPPTPDIDRRLSTYLNARGLELPEVTTADHVVEEATEFRQAWQSGDRESTVHELADVVLSVAVAARQMGTTVEACIESKTEYDRGRENA